MLKTGVWRNVLCGAVIAVSAIACADSDHDQIKKLNEGPQGGDEDNVPPPTIDQLTTGETVTTIPGVASDVTVIIDRRGMPHFYGNTMKDVLRAQGYIMARDRFAQMEFIRRTVTGTLMEIVGVIPGVDADTKASILGQDSQARLFGFARIGKQVYDSLADDDIVKVFADSYVAGVNAYIAEIRAELAKMAVGDPSADLSRFVPQGDNILLSVFTSQQYFRDWLPEDILAIARFQSFSLSFTQNDAMRSAAATALAHIASSSPSLFTPARNAFDDMTSFGPARKVFTTDPGGPGPVAVGPARTDSDPASFTPASTAALNPQTITGLRTFVQSVNSLTSLMGKDDRGSNNWLVSGAHTESGSPILSNDPHLNLTSPAVWYYTHVVAKDEGIDAEGVSFAGLPGITLGFTNDMAWGATVTYFDVSDFYAFVSPPTFDGTKWTAQTLEGPADFQPLAEPEIIHNAPDGAGGVMDFTVPIYENPNYGFLIFGAAGPTGLSVRTVNTEPSNEYGFFARLLTAKTVVEAREAQATYFKVGSQNFILATRTGDIAWQTFTHMPIRKPSARNWNGSASSTVLRLDPTTCPTFVLPAGADYQWDGAYNPTDLPALLNPAKGWIATANQDSIGVTRDGNPCNDSLYLGGDYEAGYREFRIAQKLDALTARGNITIADMQEVQATSTSSLGETIRDPIVASLSRSIDDGTLSAGDATYLTDVRDRLTAWTLATPEGTTATDAAVIADSVATTIFNVGITRVVAAAFSDEVIQLWGFAPDGSLYYTPNAAPLLERALNASATNQLGLATFDAATGDTTLWDDITTPATETRDEIIAKAFLNARTALQGRLGSDVSQWRWGRIHTVTFKAIVPASGLDVQSIPSASDPQFAAGFPRHSDMNAVDVGNYNMWNAVPTAKAPDQLTKIGLYDFSYTTGPSQRLVVEMHPDGPVAYNVLPGGQSENPNSPHHADEAAMWRVNEAPRLNFVEADVVANAELKIMVKAQ